MKAIGLLWLCAGALVAHASEPLNLLPVQSPQFWNCNDPRISPQALRLDISSLCGFECGKVARQPGYDYHERSASGARCMESSRVQAVNIPSNGVCPAGFTKKKLICGQLVRR